MKESWLPLTGHEGRYEVSDMGRIRSIARRIPLGDSGYRPISEKIIVSRPKVANGRLGAMVVTLIWNNKVNHIRVHRAVLTAFVGPCPSGMEGCHNDGDPKNNVLSNLRWDTHKSNELDKVKHGVRRLDENDIRCIQAEPPFRGVNVMLARCFSVCRETILDHRKGRYYT